MSKIHPAYLLLGPEEGEKSAFLAKLKQILESEYKETPEEYRAYGFETQIADVISILRNGSLFSAHRIVYFYGGEELSKKGEISLLESYLKKPNQCATLFIISETTKLDPRVEKLFSKDQKKIFWELFENQKRGWITKYFRDAGLSISPGAIALLLEMVENNTKDLKKECEKFVHFFKPGQTISEEDMDQYSFHSKEENVFTLFEKIADRNLEGAQEILYSIFLSKDSEPIGILAGLSWQFKNLLIFLSLLNSQYNPQDAFRKMNLRWKKSQKIYELASRNYTARETKRIIILLTSFDTSIRSNRADIHPLLLSLFLYHCIVKKGS